MRKPISLVEYDTFAGLKYLSPRPIGHHLVVAIDRIGMHHRSAGCRQLKA